MAERRLLIAANWKMNKTIAETREFFDSLTSRSTPSIGSTSSSARRSPHWPQRSRPQGPRRCGSLAQNVHQQPSGAFTGEVAIPMLAELGVGGAIVGHSERRQLFGERDESLAGKLAALLEAGLLPILCVGETEAQRDADQTEDVLRRQLEADLAEVGDADLARVVIAYEPIWAIGTGRTATPEQAQDACAFVRSLVGARDTGAAAAARCSTAAR